MARRNQRSIYLVPEFIKKLSNSNAYRPHFISLGPYHRGEPHLLPMEEHKRLAVLHMVKQANKPLQEFVAVIEDVLDELQGASGDLDDKWRGANKGRFMEMMVEDGCFVLEFIRAQAIRSEGKDYAGNDPIFSVSSSRTLWATMRRATIAMENQLPLGSSRSAEVPSCSAWHVPGYCSISPHWEGMDIHHPRTPCAVELNEAGIQFKKSNTDSIHDVDFKNGALSMKVFKFYDSTELELLNLMAFEWLHPHAKHDVSKHRNKWCAIFMNNYLSNPWVFISLVAAVILLIATIVQTIYTIVVPFYTKKS
uniref:Uncharacterized protein n=1 Tax=Setaria viridis TaxID=4556 RepID=A0A4U6TIU2_SETVI|nr:LOW QUALITY PROTEIN: hypothetical protein SEVIR_8G152700v2 [Setaria viridis]